MNDFDEIINRDDWMMAWIQKHKENPSKYPMDVQKAKTCVEQCMCDCETGMVLGVGWHGGMTPKEWEEENKYYKKVMEELNSICHQP